MDYQPLVAGVVTAMLRIPFDSACPAWLTFDFIFSTVSGMLREDYMVTGIWIS